MVNEFIPFTINNKFNTEVLRYHEKKALFHDAAGCIGCIVRVHKRYGQ